MISSISRDIGGKSYVFKLSTRAMSALEDRFDSSLQLRLVSLEDDPRIKVIAMIIQESMNDGAGSDFTSACDLVDQIGLERAGDLVSAIAEAAFEQSADDASGKKKKADQSE